MTLPIKSTNILENLLQLDLSTLTTYESTIVILLSNIFFILFLIFITNLVLKMLNKLFRLFKIF